MRFKQNNLVHRVRCVIPMSVIGLSYKNIQKYGNTSAASIPLVISELHDLGKVGPGSRVLVVGFGGGLTWGGALVEFA